MRAAKKNSEIFSEKTFEHLYYDSNNSQALQSSYFYKLWFKLGSFVLIADRLKGDGYLPE